MPLRREVAHQLLLAPTAWLPCALDRRLASASVSSKAIIAILSKTRPIARMLVSLSISFPPPTLGECCRSQLAERGKPQRHRKPAQLTTAPPHAKFQKCPILTRPNAAKRATLQPWPPLHLPQNQSASTDRYRDGRAKSSRVLEVSAESQMPTLRRDAQNLSARNVYQWRATGCHRPIALGHLRPRVGATKPHDARCHSCGGAKQP